jgi:hypothetical protein
MRYYYSSPSAGLTFNFVVSNNTEFAQPLTHQLLLFMVQLQMVFHGAANLATVTL